MWRQKATQGCKDTKSGLTVHSLIGFPAQKAGLAYFLPELEIIQFICCTLCASKVQSCLIYLCQYGKRDLKVKSLARQGWGDTEGCG